MKSRLNVIDNSGAVVAECIKVLKNAKWAEVGDEIVVAVKKARPISEAMSSSMSAAKIRKGDVRRAVIVRTKKEIRRPDGRYVRFDDNACVLLNNQQQPLGSRILGLVSAELRFKNWVKVVSLAPRVV
ncbi:54S ribosomal protein L38, mitochondrial [Coemansia sp. RSA 455]|uniref:Large ribosomal subunit protein uL14m n=5 Tax=Coemansia TaxID=4863 RepID=A0A9W8H2K0_9FUNG|nr:54S ribosomal protein L38, mitochondrial [Coemansia sp. RSA 2675]KAJ2002150.1 54S ribosomal protein L38, mitochondrial [Coemansia sp. S85]KAJ2023748.1 54S ribosomal protein L38, mitochondrial [Coemansia sp. S3946]KAJ2033013.1 54S ribosomal protein L38, mitochondrial [Coemansia sp. S2]KAJ2047339.1 54S ribosomal protein L38, mitochondrial [Coemansia sp. S155-1]KAJ2051505.1 54S ribosomal protein L38, mitochondrial [Coemansia sp. S16]KAJ2064493.1 54S ribosomal protein L38, mitochondrial [Coema